MEAVSSVIQGKRGPAGSTLKIAAVVTMLIDHIGAAVVLRMLTGADSMTSSIVRDNFETWQTAYVVMRQIGRLAFPIYCFLLVEGFQKTHDVKKYALRLGVFALVSEIPFNLAFRGKVFSPDYQNVFLTLLLALLAMWGMSLVETHVGIKWLGLLLQIPVAALGMTAAQLLHTDYAARGVFCILVMYILRRRRWQQVLAGGLSFYYVLYEPTALPAFLLIWLYNGERGIRMKYFFYWFYPVHLLVLFGVCMLMGLAEPVLF